jgi:carbamate kinase
MSTLVGPRTGGGQDHSPAPTRAQQKARALGLTSATGLVVGSIVGTGVFAMPAVLAGAVPVVAGHGSRRMHGVEAVVDKDLTASLLARQLDADSLLLLTDVAEVQDGYGTPQARPIRRATAAELRARSFPAGSMGPKIEAVCRFVEATGKPAAIGQLADARALLDGKAGTLVTP